jgi:3-oxoacyl-[acyl-carrier protein] reductase
MQFSFAQRNVLVTGGAQGIGFEIVKRFLTSGANVTLADYSEAALNSARSELKDFANLKTVMVNVADRKSCQTLAEQFNNNLHILINNAGITRDKSLLKMTDDEFDQVIQTNLTGVYNVTKTLLTKFAADAPKRIINMASIVAANGNFGQTNYVASKAGVVGMTKTWARELGKKGFTCNAIAPGFILTKMTQAMPKDVLDGIAGRVPLARLGEPGDIANACLFLASDEAAYINGVVLGVDGGLVL